MDKLLESLYWFFTDLCINLANLLGISYVEFNMGLFLIFLPGIVIALAAANIWRYVLKPGLRRIREK